MWTWRGKINGVPYEKGWKITKRVTCVYGGGSVPMKGKINDFVVHCRGSPTKRLENHKNRNLCLGRGICAHEDQKYWFLTETAMGSPTKKAGKITKKVTCVFEGEHAFMKRRSRCWCLELYRAFVADVFCCITFPLLMSWAVSRFYWWCLELYDTFVFVLSCITLLLRMSWALSRFCCWCLELYRASVADVLSCIALLLLMSWAVSLCDSGLFNIIYSCLFFHFSWNKKLILSLGFRVG